ncbi:MAG: LysM peptidoglycan-binding domain-containing protein [Sulfurovum sp.]
MMKNYFKFILLYTVLVSSSYAKSIVDCRVVTQTKKICDPYTSQLIYVKEIDYDIDRKKLIMQKSLPIPKVKKVRVISVDDMIEGDEYIQESMRYIGTDNISIEDKKVDKNKTKKPKYGIYLIVSGDNLSKIASRFNMKTRALRDFNKLNGNSPLRIGQELKIPFAQEIVDGRMSGKYKIKRGDHLGSIANKFDVKLKKLIKYNHFKRNTIMRIGHIIKLPLPYILKIEKRKREIEAKRQAVKKVQLDKKRKKDIKRRDKISMRGGIGKRKLRVTATAYSSHANQTDSTPFLAAWNNHIRPGMRIIAVSRDMLTRYRMRNGTRVRIGGLPGYYTVRDKMNKRYKKRIDIYMGMNRRKALRWGRRSVVIYW